MNEEFPVNVSHKLALITSLPFVHTAGRYYRLNASTRWRFGVADVAGKMTKLDHLEEVKVVTRFP
jgi:hypothetical protein